MTQSPDTTHFERRHAYNPTTRKQLQARPQHQDDFSSLAFSMYSQAELDHAADLWDTDAPSSTDSKSNNGGNTDVQDVYMTEDSETLDVTLVGSDGFSVKCSSANLFQQSNKLCEMLAGGNRIELPMCWRELQVLGEALDHRSMAARSWSAFALEDLVRAVDMFCFYKFKDWPTYAIETAILDHLETGRQEHNTRLCDERYIAKVRCSAQQAGAYRLLALIDRGKPAVPEEYGSEDCRPRKWQKISAKSRVFSKA